MQGVADRLERARSRNGPARVPTETVANRLEGARRASGGSGIPESTWLGIAAMAAGGDPKGEIAPALSTPPPTDSPDLPEIGQHIASRFTEGVAAGIGDVLDSINVIIEHAGGDKRPGRFISPGPALQRRGISPEETLSQAFGTVAQQVLPPVESMRGSLTGDVAAGVGSSVPFMATGLASKAFKFPRVAQLLLVAGHGAAVSGANAYEEALAKGATPEEAWHSFLVTGAVAGPTELVPIARMLGRIDRRSGGAFREAVGAILREGVEEGGQEVAQQILASTIAKHIYDEEREILDRGLVRTGGAGFLTGVFLSALTSGAVKAREQGADESGGEIRDSGQIASDGLGTEQGPSVSAPGALESTEDAPGVGAVGGADLGAGPALPQTQASDVPGPEGASRQPSLITLSGEPIAAAPDPAIPLQPLTASGSVQPATGEALASDVPPPPGSATGARAAAEPVSSAEEDAPAGERPPVTSLKTRITDAELESLGIEPPEGPTERRAWADLNTEAERMLREDPLAGSQILERLSEESRPPTDQEWFVLLRERNRLWNQRDALQAEMEAAQAAGDAEAMADVAMRTRATRDYIHQATEAIRKHRSASGRSLAALKAEMARDYSLAAMEQEVEAAQGGQPLTPEQQAEIVDLNKRIDAAMARVTDLERRQAAAELERIADEATEAIKRTVKRSPRRRGPVLDRLSREAQAARERMRQRATWMRSGPNTEDLRDQIIIGADFIARTAHDFAAWSSEMVKEFGEKIRPYLQTIFDFSRRHVAQAEVEELSAKAKAAGDEVPPALIRELAEVFVRDGITEREPLVDAVHAALPEMERSAVARAIAGYGEFQPLSKDAAKVRLREIRGELRELAKLEDMEKGLVPLKSGPERQTPTTEQRRLIKKVNEAKKKLGIRATPADPERALATALDTIKTRLRNQIEDLQRQIDAKARDIKVKTPGPRDAEVAELERQRDALQEQFDEVFAQEKQADRVPALQRALEKSIADYERRISTGDIAPRKPGAQPSTPALEALRARRDALREELELLRRAAKPKKSPDEIALQAAKARMANETARLREAITYGDFRKRPKPKPVALDKEALDAKAHLDALRREHAEGVEATRLRNRTRMQKARDLALEVLNDLPKALKTAWDDSAVLRQGLLFTVDPARLPTTVKALGRSLRAMASEEYARRVESAINNRPLAAQAKAAGLELTSWGSDLTRAEEAIRSRFSDKIPGVKASNRAFSTYLNLHRATAFDLWMLAAPNATPAEQKAFAGAINVFTGRADVGPELSRHLNTAGKVLWSPRLWLSRLQLMAGQPLWRGTARTRKLIAAQMARSLLGWMALRTLVSLSLDADDDETDPRSSDFGKIKIGDYRLDPGAGILQNAVLASRLLAGVITPGEEFKSTKTGKFRELRIDDVFRFLQNKVTPTIGSALYARFGDYENDDPSAVDVARHMLEPLAFQGMYDAMADLGVPRGAALSALSWFGWGLQNYGDDKPTKKPSASLAVTR